MKVTVCELPNNWINSEPVQEKLKSHLNAEKSDLLLLPEMPFYSWLAGSRDVDQELWAKAVDNHQAMIERLGDLKVGLVAGTRPILKNGAPHNEGFIWTKAAGAVGGHEKYYLPNEEGFWEATWYRRGDGVFKVIEAEGITFGFLICTEMWFNHRAREYGKAGMDILLCPRATPATSTGSWVAGGRAAANVSGAFCLSSNFNGSNTPDMDFGGTGWIVEPEEGNLLGTTSEKEPFLTMEIDINLAEQAKKSYPRYVED
ncbi:carbon-nitrogen hydrolase family protein [Dethiosulfatarculus sandiegensis]|uniref:Nitrilase n=1 Tax=Dethiosulfatarculus sandiegensis TaxID=1429043 RepID=A0A0D2GKK1_9BACT|nr:carbon-nitrogen hydrolase family protein [Dethiosulfatarculus sandiegensis]KIX15292.1 nitrilase [Dethiosulfatarculus sandiegensis]